MFPLRTIRPFLYFLTILLATTAVASAGHVQTELLSDVSGIQPGKPFWLGVRLTLDPGWHVYWRNPGDTGLPTRVKFTLPDGFTVGPLEYPTPNRFELPGNILALGYENTVMLLAKVTPPQNLPPDFHGQFTADASWLVCSDVCIPGKATATLSLSASPNPSPANKELFDDWSSQIPQKWNSNPEVAGVDVSSSGKELVVITWTHAAPETVDFLPESPDDYNIIDTQTKSTNNTTVIRFTAQPLDGKKPPAMTMETVVGYLNQDGKRRGLIIPIALPAVADNNH